MDNLPPELLLNIFFFIEEDTKTLYNSLFIRKKLCEIVKIFLWRTIEFDIINQIAFEKFMQLLRDSSKNSKKNFLYLTFFSVKSMESFRDDDLYRLITLSPLMKGLHIIFCPNIFLENIPNIPRNNLKILEIRDFARRTGETRVVAEKESHRIDLINLLKWCPNLTDLTFELHKCKNLNHQIAEHCTHLEKLYILGPGDDLMIDIIHANPNLSSMYIAWSNVTIKTCRAMKKHLINLRSLRIESNHLTPDLARNILRTKFPQIVIC